MLTCELKGRNMHQDDSICTARGVEGLVFDSNGAKMLVLAALSLLPGCVAAAQVRRHEAFLLSLAGVPSGVLQDFVRRIRRGKFVSL